MISFSHLSWDVPLCWYDEWFWALSGHFQYCVMQFWFLLKSSILVQSAYLNLGHISLATYLDCDSNVNLVSRLFRSSLFVCYPVVNLKPARLFTWYFFLRGFCFVFGFIHEPVGGCTQDSIGRFKQFLSSAASLLYSPLYLGEGEALPFCCHLLITEWGWVSRFCLVVSPAPVGEWERFHSWAERTDAP